LVCANVEEPSDRLIDAFIAWQWNEASTDEFAAVFAAEVDVSDFDDPESALSEMLNEAFDSILDFMGQPIRGSSEFDSEG
jgi:hypothetical protein